MYALHASAVGGHSGFQVTYARVRKLFACPGTKKQIKDYVAACVTCARAKPEHVRYPGLLQPLPVPHSAWQVVSLDFIEALPRSSGFTCILVVVDKLTKYAHFLALAHPFTGLQVAQVYINQVYRLHGMPSSLISDRDRIFTSASGGSSSGCQIPNFACLLLITHNQTGRLSV